MREVTKIVSLLTSAFVVAVSVGQAQSITNGSMTGVCANAGVPTGWSAQLASPDIVDPSCNVGVPALGFAASASSSPDGGTWVGLGREGGVFIERFGQVVGGFTIGQSYTLSWYVSNFGTDQNLGYTNPNQIEFLLSGVSAGTGSMRALGQGWFAESVIFIATAASHDIAFQLGSGNKSYMGIDGVALAATGTDVVPEPATMTLLATGLAGMAAARRKKRA